MEIKEDDASLSWSPSFIGASDRMRHCRYNNKLRRWKKNRFQPGNILGVILIHTAARRDLYMPDRREYVDCQKRNLFPVKAYYLRLFIFISLCTVFICVRCEHCSLTFLIVLYSIWLKNHMDLCCSFKIFVCEDDVEVIMSFTCLKRDSSSLFD